MPALSRSWPDPRVKPPYGAAEINWGHPLTNGLKGYFPCNDLTSGYTITNLVNGVRTTGSFGAPTSIASGGGIGVVGTTGGEQNNWNADPFTGLASFAIYSWIYVASRSGMGVAAGALGIGKWGSNILNRVESSTLVRGLFGFSGGNIDQTITDSWGDGRVNSVCWSVSAATVTGYTNGVSRGSLGGSGTMTANATGYEVFLGGQGSNGAILAPNAGIAAAAYTRALSAGEVLWLHAEPYAMLRPIVRRRYFALGGSTIPRKMHHYQMLRT